MSKTKVPQAQPAHVQNNVYSFYWYVLPPALLAVLSAIFYAPSLHYSFQFDDIANITKYFNIRNNSFGSLFFTGTRWISYWLNSFYYKMSKFDPFVYRTGNVLFHTTTSIIIFFFVFLVLSNRKTQSFFKKKRASSRLQRRSCFCCIRCRPKRYRM